MSLVVDQLRLQYGSHGASIGQNIENKINEYNKLKGKNYQLTYDSKKRKITVLNSSDLDPSFLQNLIKSNDDYYRPEVVQEEGEQNLKIRLQDISPIDNALFGSKTTKFT